MRWMLVVIPLCVAGCQADLYDPDQATRRYPFHLHEPNSVDIQVFREDERLRIYNATATTYRDFDLWLNQRYVAHIGELPAGGNIAVSLWDFRDWRGEVINAGGLFRADEPTPVRLAQMQLSDDQPLIGLITIRAEPAE